MYNSVGILNFLFICWFCEISMIIQVTFGQIGGHNYIQVYLDSSLLWFFLYGFLSNIYLMTEGSTLGRRAEEGRL